MCFRVQVAIKSMSNQLIQLGALESVELVVTVCFTSKRSSKLNQI